MFGNSIVLSGLDTVNPSVSSFSPADDATAVATATNLTATFTEDIAFGTGTIDLYDSDDDLIESFDVETDVGTDPGEVSISGAVLTINPTAALEEVKGHYVQIDATAIDDLAGNSFAGIADKTTWSFTTADETAPTVDTVAFSSSPATGSTYGIGEDIEVTVTFTEAVDVTGTPQITLDVGGATKEADYASGTGTTELVFAYTILAGDTDADGVSIDANSLALNGGTIKDGAGNNATLTHSAVTDDSGHKVDTTAPSLSSPTDAETSDTEADLGVDTDEGNGTLYWVVTTSGTAPSAAQVKAGLDNGGSAAADSGSQAVSGTGTQAISGGATGLTAETTYTAHFMHEDATGNQSSVASGDGFTTEAAAGGIDAILVGNSGGYWDPSDASTCWQDIGKTTPAGNGDSVAVIEDASGNGHDFVYDNGRPTRVQAAGGEWYLQFTATSGQRMLTGSFQLSKTTEGEWFSAAGIMITGTLSASGHWSILISDQYVSGLRIGQFLRVDSTDQLEAIAFTAAPAAATDSGGSVVQNTYYRASSEAAYNAGTETVEAFINNSGNGATSIASLRAGASQALALGGLYSGSGWLSNLTGRIYRVFFVDRALSAGEKTTVDTWLSGNAP